ncbi:MAG: SpoIIIAH-like family protein [Clostridia bacterium]
MEPKRKSFFLLILALLVFTVGAALFSGGNDMVYEPSGETEKTENDGEDQAVSAAAAENRDFFSDFRIGREQRRDEKEELYLRVLEDPARDENARSEAEEGLEQLYRVASMEDQVEEILIGRNYRDAIFVMGENISLLMLNAPDLGEDEKAALSAFVCSYTGVEENRLSVFTVE